MLQEYQGDYWFYSADWSTEVKNWSKTSKLIMPLQQIIEQSSTDLLETDSFYENESTLPIYPLYPTNLQVSPTDHLVRIMIKYDFYK